MDRWWGPIFEAERVVRARRWQGYATRSGFVLALLGGLLLVRWQHAELAGPMSVRELAAIGGSLHYALTLLQLIAVLVIAPASTAGAICLDRASGTLLHIFATDLTGREVVLGKLAARLLPIWMLLACALPVAALATMLGGIDPAALGWSVAIAASLAWLGGTLGLLLSVWAGKPHEVIAVVYLAWAAWLLPWPTMMLRFGGSPGADWLEVTNPFYLAHAPYNHPGEIGMTEPALFCLGCALIGAACAAIAMARVRAVTCRSPAGRARRAARPGGAWNRLATPIGRAGGPQLDANPVRWREWHRERPSRWTRVAWGGFTAACLAAAGCLAGGMAGGLGGRSALLIGGIMGVLATLGLLLVSTATAAVLAEERTRGSLDVLLCTPLSTREILVGKWWGAFRRVPWVAVGVVSAGAAGWVAGPLGPVQVLNLALVPALIVAQGAALASLGLALATHIRRTGLATLATIGIALATAVTWPLAGFLLLESTSNWNGPRSPTREIWDLGQTLGSPFTGVGVPILVALVAQGPATVEADRAVLLCFQSAWVVGYALAAWLLFEATVRTFDRRLGRVPGRAARPGPASGRQRLGLENS